MLVSTDQWDTISNMIEIIMKGYNRWSERSKGKTRYDSEESQKWARRGENLVGGNSTVLIPTRVKHLRARL